MIPGKKISLVLLIVAVALSRWEFRSHDLYDLDSVNFALAMQRFDPRVHQPHPPGYFLYIAAGRLLNGLFHDANLALVVLSILASCGVVIVIYSIASEWFGLMAARFAGILFLVSPLAWFHGIVALTYIVEAFFSALIGYLCWRILSGREGFVIPAAIALGLSAGIRPSSLLFLAPLFLFSLRKSALAQIFLGLAALAATLAAWSVPMIVASGGLRAYFEALTFLWQSVPSKTTVFNSSPVTSIARALTIVLIFLLCFGAVSIVPLIPLFRAVPVDRRKRNFTIVWIFPALCFFTFGYLKFVNSGYLLLLIPPVSLWLGLWLSEWYEKNASPRPIKLAVLASSALLNTFIFLAAPFYCSYRQVRRFEANLDGIRTAIPRLTSPDDTLILSVDSHFNGFRHAGYYLPGYLTIEYPEVKLGEGPRIFTMRQRDTKLLATLPVASFRRFIIFPLPDGGTYREYLQKLTARIPSQNLHRSNFNGQEYITGSTSDLPLLFPDAISPP